CSRPPSALAQPVELTLSSKTAGSAVKKTLLIASLSALDFGTLPQGGRHEATFSLHNPGPTAVEVATIKTSCPCFRVSLPANVVLPGTEVTATATVDFAEDPDFTGSLAMDAEGTVEAQPTPAFVVIVSVKVEATIRGR